MDLFVAQFYLDIIWNQPCIFFNNISILTQFGMSKLNNWFFKWLTLYLKETPIVWTQVSKIVTNSSGIFRTLRPLAGCLQTPHISHPLIIRSNGKTIQTKGWKKFKQIFYSKNIRKQTLCQSMSECFG